MEHFFARDELEITRHLMDIAFANAATSFSKMIRKTVSLEKPIKLKEEVNQVLHVEVNTTDELMVLVSTAKGEIGAESYLLFSKEDFKYLIEISLSQYEERKREMYEAFLLELDNILTAAVIAQFAEHFQIDLFGMPPTMKKMTLPATQDFIHQQMHRYDMHFFFDVNFLIHDANFSPKFIWLFDYALLDNIKCLKNNAEALAVIKKQREALKQV